MALTQSVFVMDKARIHKGSVVNDLFEVGIFERVFTLGYCPELDQDDGVRPLSKRQMSNFTLHDGYDLANKVKKELFRLQNSHGLLEE